MAQRLYTNAKIFIPDPFVIRVDHDFKVEDSSAFRHFPKLARSRVQGTWGHTKPRYETVYLRPQPTHPLTPDQRLAALFGNDDVEVKVRSYWFFEDTMDATTFRLSIGERATHVMMWPEEIRFTIYENEP